MKTKTFFLNFILFSNLCFSQTIFQKTIGGAYTDEGHFVQQTADGGFVITGYTTSFGTGISGNVYLIKTNSGGNIMWTKTFGGSANSDNSNCVWQTNDEGYIITGFTWSFGAGNRDVYLIRTNSSGNILWTKAIGGANNDRGTSVQQTSDGNFVIAGYTASFGAGLNDAYLIKVNSSGDTLWTKTYGGTNNDEGNSLQQTNDGGFIIAGRTNSFGTGGWDVYLIRTDSNGDTLWTKTYGGINNEDGKSIQQTNDGGFAISGYTSSFGAGLDDVYLIKTDSNGNIIWTKTYGGAGSDAGYSIRQTTDGGIFVTGATNSFGAGSYDAYAIRTNSDGDTLWTKAFGKSGYEYANSAWQSGDGGFIITGVTDITGDVEVYLIKTDSNGNSGCNQNSTSTVVNSFMTTTSNSSAQVSSGAIINTPAAITGTGGGILTDVCPTVSVQASDISETVITIFPNPFNEEAVLTVQNPNSNIQSLEIKICDLFGKEVIKNTVHNSGSLVINRSNIPGGIYYIQVIADGQIIDAKKIVAQ